MTLIDPWLRFQGHASVRRWISQKRYDYSDIHTWLLTANKSNMWHIQLSHRYCLHLPSRPFQLGYIFKIINPAYFSGFWLSSGDLTKDVTLSRVTFEAYFRYYKRFHCLPIKWTACMHEVNYSGRTSLWEQYFLLSYATGWCWARSVSDS